MAFIEQWLIVDEVIFPKYRGHKLAAQAQLTITQALNRFKLGTSLWGTIAPQNLPSLKTAEMAGRSAQAAYVFWGPDSFD